MSRVGTVRMEIVRGSLIVWGQWSGEIVQIGIAARGRELFDHNPGYRYYHNPFEIFHQQESVYFYH